MPFRSRASRYLWPAIRASPATPSSAGRCPAPSAPSAGTTRGSCRGSTRERTAPSAGCARAPAPAEPGWAAHAELHGEAGEDRLHAHGCQPRADVVILGEAVGVERLVVGLRAQCQQRAPRETGTNTGRRHHAGHALAHHQILGVPFGELVHVDPGHQFVPLAVQRGDRQLDHVLARQQVVVEAQFHRVQHVLAVVQDHAGELDVVALLVIEDRQDQPVQAVGLAGRPVMRHLHAAQALVAAAHALDFIDGLLVVGIGADEHDVLAVVEHVDHVLHHLRDDVVLHPRRHHDCQRLLRPLHQVFLGQWPVRFAPLDGERAPTRAPSTRRR